MKKKKPYVICHMTTSIDGKVTGSFLNSEQCIDATNEYYRINREHPANAFACGRVTMEESFTKGWYPDLSEFKGIHVEKEDFTSNQHAQRYAVAFDRKGRLGWISSCIEDEDPGYGGAHIIEVLTKEAPEEYLAYLQKIGVSYLFAGETEIDLETALKKLYSIFSIDTLLIEGGSIINGAFERADLIDELCLVQAPVIADAASKPLFDNSVLSEYVLTDTQVISKQVLVLRYIKSSRQRDQLNYLC